MWKSDFGKWGQNRPKSLVHEKGTDTHTDRRTLRLLDQISPVGRFDENKNLSLEKTVLQMRSQIEERICRIGRK